MIASAANRSRATSPTSSKSAQSLTFVSVIHGRDGLSRLLRCRMFRKISIDQLCDACKAHCAVVLRSDERGATMRINVVMIAVLSLVPAPVFGQIGNQPGTGYVGVPYTAVQTTTMDSNTQTAMIARDARGRTRRESITEQNGSEVHIVQVMDPIAGVTLMW